MATLENKALRITGNDTTAVVTEALPTLPTEEYIIVKVAAVALNPTDWKHVIAGKDRNLVGALVGCDFAGTVYKIGSAVTKDFKIGDRVCGMANGSDAGRLANGAFANYIIVRGDLTIRIPDNLSNEEAATLGIAVSTVGQGLYQALKLALPTTPIQTKEFVFIYGGTTAMGISGIQYAKASGYTVITAASPRHFDYVKSLGAEHVFDYRSPTISEDIRKLTDNKLKLAWDTICSDESVRLIAAAISTDGGKVATLLPKDGISSDVNPKAEFQFTLAYSIFNEPYFTDKEHPANPTDWGFAKMFWELSKGLYANGTIKSIRVDVNRTGKGLEGIPAGLAELKEGKVSAEKLVYTLE